jgi:hypothetical protein
MQSLGGLIVHVDCHSVSELIGGDMQTAYAIPNLQQPEAFFVWRFRSVTQ